MSVVATPRGLATDTVEVRGLITVEEVSASPLGKRGRRPSVVFQVKVEEPMKDAEAAAIMAEAVDTVIVKAYQLEREVKEAEEDEKMPGALGQCASATKRRARRKSKELERQFQELMAERLEKVFHHFDADGNGTLDPSELKAAFDAAGRPSDEDTIASAMSALDTNNDGLIDLEEFKAIAWRTFAPPVA